PKDPSEYTIVGKPVPREDLPPKILGHYKYVTDIRVPEMLHGRVVRPSGVGATFVSMDESAAKAVPGYVKTVVKGSFVGVVAETEWGAIQAAKALRVTWTEPKQAFPEQKNLYEHMRSVTPKATKETLKVGDADAALAGAAKKVEASYEFPFQSHATMGPGCSVADVHTDGVTTVWCGGQKPHALQKGYAELLRVPLDSVRVVWVEDAGSYGRPGFEDAGADALLLSEAVGKPVRVQWMREDMTGWGTKGPAVICDLSAALDANGEATAVKFTSRAFSGGETYFRPSDAGNYLGVQLTGIPNTSGIDEFAQWGDQTAPYVFQNLHAMAHVVPAFYDSASPMRTSHLRDPEGPATSFATESFMDEIAAAAGADPVAFRIKHLDDARAKAVLTTAAQKAGWDARPSPKKASSGDIATGRGIG
ncbi:MAG: xanthine dehydrogenase family protein molybdopterin-binding subunit, partial [Candidatus Acidiferrales bacterium]